MSDHGNRKRLMGIETFLWLMSIAVLTALLTNWFYGSTHSDGHSAAAAIATTASSQHSFKQLQQRYQSACTAAGVNRVLGRVEELDVLLPDSMRPWSLTDDTHQPSESRTTQPLSLCNTTQQLLDSLRFGQRESPDAVRSGRFQPSHCSYRWRSSDELCAVAARFSDVLFMGDSQLRHTTQSLFGLLSDDLRFGSLPRLSSPSLYTHCVCDGQYSEHALCRAVSESQWQLGDVHSYGVCSRQQQFHFQYQIALPLEQLCHNSKRPRAVVMSAGAHYASNATRTIAEFLLPQLLLLERVQRECAYQFEVVVIWSGLFFQAQWLDVHYPWQQRAMAVAHNTAIDAFLAKRTTAAAAAAARTIPVLTAEFMNLTTGAATSDGVHMLTEPHALKVMYLMGIMDAWADESAAGK